ncbi:MAG: hypothetical protein WBA74_13425 [Cyclobacteriaceae bacterium]
MKYLLWFNKLKEKFNYGSREKYLSIKRFYGDNIIEEQEFENVSEDIIRKVTRSINRQNKEHHVIA